MGVYLCEDSRRDWGGLEVGSLSVDTAPSASVIGWDGLGWLSFTVMLCATIQ